MHFSECDSRFKS